MKLLFIVLLIFCFGFQSVNKNQAIVEASKEYPAIVFKSLTISMDSVSEGKVSATLHSDGFDDALIERKSAGYQVTYNRFTVRIQSVGEDSATFFVQRD